MKAIARFVAGPLFIISIIATSSFASDTNHASSEFKAVFDKKTGFVKSLRKAGESDDIEFTAFSLTARKPVALARRTWR